MPQTSFSCRDKILGGYYADPETNCQMFHICVKIAGVGVSWSIHKRRHGAGFCVKRRMELFRPESCHQQKPLLARLF